MRVSGCGCLLMVLALGLLVGMTVIPALLPSLENAAVIREPLQRLLCTEGETLEGEQSVTNPRAGQTAYSMIPYCVDREGQRRLVQEEYFLYSLVGFVVPFVTGLVLLIGGSITASRHAQRHLVGSILQAAQTSTPRITTVQWGNIEPATEPATLAERLSELKQAYDAGLISQTEYETKRAEILKTL